jgi:hypothetical protein
LRRVGLTPSPITGAQGNQEFLLHLRPGPDGPAAGPAPDAAADPRGSDDH